MIAVENAAATVRVQTKIVIAKKIVSVTRIACVLVSASVTVRIVGALSSYLITAPPKQTSLL